MLKYPKFVVCKRPVIICHGITSSSLRMEPLARHLRDRGRITGCIDFVPNEGELRLAQYALQLKRFIERVVPDGQSIDIVGHSMGGVIVTAYLQLLGGADRTVNHVSVSAPHAGTLTAYLWIAPGVVDMRPGSKLLTQLANSRAKLAKVRTLTVRTSNDLVIQPPESSILSVAVNNLEINSVQAHDEMMSDPLLHDAVWRHLL
jgi:triacylglycerol lipase